MDRRRDDSSEIRHKRAATIEHLIKAFMVIKSMSRSAEIDRICVDGVSKLYEMSEAYGLQKELDEIRSRRIDPTM